MRFETVGVIGAGVMGQGVAQNLAQAGVSVILVDLTDAILQAARRSITNNLRLTRLLGAGAHQENAADLHSRITLTTDYNLLSNVDFIIENAPEKWEIKKPIYEQIDRICDEQCIFAANTSVFSITRIASVTGRADRVIGIHFMNPVPLKKTVEIARGYHTSQQTLDSTQELLKTMGKEWIVIADTPGFISNRVLMLTINEAIFLVQEQVAPAMEIDKVFKACFGHAMGPLETADLIGLDTILYSIEALYESYNDSKYRPCPLLKKMVDAGLYGKKSGHGFYTYS